MSAGRNLLGLVAAVQAALSANLEPDGPSDHDTLTTVMELMDCAEQRAAEAQAQQDETDGELWRFASRSADPSTTAFRAHVAAGLAAFKAEAH